MAALKCEICSGTLIGKPGGVFECEYCGVQYDTSWAKAKIQEIRGTVQVEGTVEITGTVKVEGGSSVESLIKRAWLSIEDKQFETALKCFEQVLNIEPELGEAHFGIAMAKARATSPEKYASHTCFISQPHLDRARKCNDKKCMELLAQYDAAKEKEKQLRQEKELEREHQKEQDEAQKEEQKVKERAQHQAFCALTNKLRKRIEVTLTGAFGILADGTVQCVGQNAHGELNVADWNNIIAIAGAEDHTIGLDATGMVYAVGKNKTGCCDVASWNGIVKIATCESHTVGLTKDGHVYCTPLKGTLNKYGQNNVSGWQNIKDIAAAFGFTAAVRDDGKLLYCGHTGVNFDEFVKGYPHKLIAVDAGHNTFVALSDNGKVLGCNLTSGYTIDTSLWEGVVQVAAGFNHVVGLRKDGTVIATGEMHDGSCNVSGWKDIVAIAADFGRTMGLKRDGTIVQTGYQFKTVNNWKLFESVDTLGDEEIKAKAQIAEKRKAEQIAKQETEQIALGWQNAGLCQHCGGTFKGLFTKKCANCGKEKDY